LEHGPSVNLTKRASLPSFLGLLCLGIIPNLRNRKRLGRQVYGGAVASVSFISDCLEQAPIRLRETCEDLTQEEVLCRLALLQQCRSHPLACDTGRGQSDTPTGKRVYVVGGWHEKFGQPVDAPDPADRMSLRVLAIPDLTVLLAGRFDGRQPWSAHLPVPAWAECGRKLAAFNQTHEQSPRSGDLHPRPPEPELGPPSRHRCSLTL